MSKRRMHMGAAGGGSKAVALNWQFALGAATIPALVGVSSRILDRTQWKIPRYATQGVFLVANGVAAFFVGVPFLWGALLGQVPVAVDTLADAVANLIVPAHRGAHNLPGGATKGPSGIYYDMGSAEPDAQGRSAGQVTAEDVAELERLQRELTTMSGSNLGYRDREDINLGAAVAVGAPSSFK